MATSAHRLIQDQNLNVLYNGTTPGGNHDVAKADKRGGGFGGRKALNDISNSRKPSSFHSVKKENSLNVISIGKDPSAVKGKSSMAPGKGARNAGRKALTDLTNSVKPPPKQQAPILGQKLLKCVAENVPSCIAEEGFLHNHRDCIKAQMTGVNKDYFLKSVGLCKPSAMQALPLSSYELEELPDDQDSEIPGWCSPACRSPLSPKSPCMSWGEGDNVFDLMLREIPELK